MKQKLLYAQCILVATIIGALLLSVWLSLAGQSALALPPPLPTMTPTPAPRPTSPLPPPVTGGLIELQAQFPQTWPWDEAHWQALWTVVQWQDKGNWYDVEGWQGTLDEAAFDATGNVVGKKMWWVAKGDLGTGPFRWQVYRSQGGRLLVTSDTFDLPEAVNRITVVEVALSP